MNFRPTKPGLFITGTDTEVGKTVATCAIAAALRASGRKVGVCKPIATGCRREREGLVSDDAEALAHFSDCRTPLDVINPVRYRPPVAPAVAAESSDRPVDDNAIAASLTRLDAEHDVLLVEGIGGALVPLDAKRTVLTLAKSIGYPVLVVTRAELGTLNHTALTCQAIRSAGLKLAGLIINRYKTQSTDASAQTNPLWLSRQNRTSVLATLPESEGVAPQRGQLPVDLLEAARLNDWMRICGKP